MKCKMTNFCLIKSDEISYSYTCDKHSLFCGILLQVIHHLCFILGVIHMSTPNLFSYCTLGWFSCDCEADRRPFLYRVHYALTIAPQFYRGPLSDSEASKTELKASALSKASFRWVLWLRIDEILVGVCVFLLLIKFVEIFTLLVLLMGSILADGGSCQIFHLRVYTTWLDWNCNDEFLVPLNLSRSL